MALTHVLEPIRINQVEIRNRILRTGHGTYYGQGGITDRLIAYHEARAKAGVGLSTAEVTVVHPTSDSNRTIYGWDDSIIPGFRELTTAVHRHGMKMFVQLWHGGHHWPPSDGTPAWSASNVPSPWGGVPIAMDEEQIDEIIRAFAATAVRAREGGMDGVEMHFGHGYLIHQFFSPYTNMRTDRYGGSLENRMRFGREILRAARKAAGDDFAIGMRISDSNAPGGVTIDECTEIVRSYAGEGLIDFVNGSMGSYHSTASMLPAMDTPVGAMMPSAGPIVAGANDTPRVVRMVTGRFQTLEELDQLIREGAADMVSIVRGMIADPDLVSKTLAGKAEEVRPCIGCNQGCVGGILGPAGRITCTVNPTVGMERTLHEDLIVKTATPKKVVIVGGGPAGMEAARLAALSGHQTILFEAQNRLGGAVNIARRAPKLHPIGDIILWLEREIYRLGVDVRLSTYAEHDEIIAESPDVVIVATGSVPRMDGIQAFVPGLPAKGVEKSHVYSSHEIFDVPREKLGNSAVIFDDTGHYEAIGVAEYLAEQGLAITYITRHSSFAPTIERTTRHEPTLVRLRQHNFKLVVRGRLINIGDGVCDYGYLEGDTVEQAPADCVVLVTDNMPMADVHASLMDRRNEDPPFTLKLIGDAMSPRDLQAAIADGHMAGRFCNA